jgi:hypothetical protein
MHSAGYEHSALPSAHAFLSLAADAPDARGEALGHRDALYSDAEFPLVIRSVQAHMAKRRLLRADARLQYMLNTDCVFGTPSTGTQGTTLSTICCRTEEGDAVQLLTFQCEMQHLMQ